MIPWVFTRYATMLVSSSGYKEASPCLYSRNSNAETYSGSPLPMSLLHGWWRRFRHTRLGDEDGAGIAKGFILKLL